MRNDDIHGLCSYFHQISFRWSNQLGSDGGGICAYGREQEWFWYTDLNDKDHLEGLGVKRGQY